MAYKVKRIGNQLRDKLEKKYEGPYKVVKVQANRVSYEVQHCVTQKGVKAHHRQLKPWLDPPKYLERYLALHNVETVESIVSKSGDDTESSSEKRIGGLRIMNSTSSSSDSSESTESSSEERVGGLRIMGSTNSSSNNSSLGVGDRERSESDRTSISMERSRETGESNNSVMDNREDSGESSRSRKQDDRRRRGRKLAVVSEELEEYDSNRGREGCWRVVEKGRLGTTWSGFQPAKDRGLQKLHCSEPVDYDIGDCLAEEMFAKFKYDGEGPSCGCNLLDWDVSVVQGDKKGSTERGQECKCSTPVSSGVVQGVVQCQESVDEGETEMNDQGSVSDKFMQ